MLAKLNHRLLPLLAVAATIALTSAALARVPAASNDNTTKTTAFVSMVTSDEAIAQIDTGDGVLRFEVSENFTRVVEGDYPLHDDGKAAHGNIFITQGYIYPVGTLKDGTGVLEDGSPEFPDKVLGEWNCYGWLVGDGAHTTSGPWGVTTQLYNFGGEWGDATLASEGYELASDMGVGFERAVIGGTGPFADARGEVRMTPISGNAINGINLSFEIELVED